MSEERPVNVVIADDHALLRDSMTAYFNGKGDIRIVGEAGCGDSAWEKAVELRPDVLLLNVEMPGRETFGICRQLSKSQPETKVLFISSHTNDTYVDAAHEAGAAGFMSKTEHADVVAGAIKTVAGGGQVFSKEFEARLAPKRGTRRARGASRLSALTPRELETLRYIARGMSKKAIAELVGISVKTVDNHCTSLMNKLDIHDRVELARFAIREGLAEA